MANNVTVYDLDNYPDNSKTVTNDLKLLTPIGYEGDEQWVLSFVTTAYSNNTSRTAIQDIYIREMKAGWLKSSGFAGNNGKFTIVSGTANQLNVKMDNSSQFYKIELAPGTNVTGEQVAEDMQTKVRAIPDSAGWSTADNGYSLSYKNALVDYTGGRFIIVSGNIGKYYTGASRSSVAVSQYSTDTTYSGLGFDISISSETLSGNGPSEVLLASDFTAGATTMTVSAGLGAVDKDCCVITDGTNTDYFQATVVSGTTLTVSDGIASSYTANVAKVQLLRIQDPSQEPNPYHNTIDSLVRFGIDSISNQLDFSS